MLCSISGVAPVEPVFSVKSGHVYEKRLIVKHLKATNTCPMTNDELSEADLIAVVANPSVKPRPPAATSIPSLIQTLQNEWDAAMLETFTMKQHNESLRQELAHALYQHDAACRVIARLIKERDAARSQLGDTEANVGSALQKASGSSGGKAQAGAGIAGNPVKVMGATAKALSKGRKKRIKAAQASVASASALSKYKATSSNPLHSAAKPGITCLDLHATNQDLVATGGADGNNIVFNRSTSKIVATLKGHKKKVTDVKFHPTEDLLFSTSADNNAIIWAGANGKYTKKAVLSNHKDSVVGCTVHPSGQFLVTASQDRTWNFYDVATAACLQTVGGDKVTDGYSKVTFHPDGLILATGTADSFVRIFEAKQQKNVATFKGHSGKVSALAFSENGYYLASGDETGVVKLWDLRKLQNFHTIEDKKIKSVGDLCFDASGTYLTVAGADVRAYATKGWELVKNWGDHSKQVTGVRVTSDASALITTSMDRSLKVFSG